MNQPNQDDEIKSNRDLKDESDMENENESNSNKKEFGEDFNCQQISDNNMIKGEQFVNGQMKKSKKIQERGNIQLSMTHQLSQKNNLKYQIINSKLQQGYPFDRQIKFGQENQRHQNQSKLELEVESFQISQKSSASCIKNVFELNQFTSEKRKKLHKCPVFFGRRLSSTDKQNKYHVQQPDGENLGENKQQIQERFHSDQNSISIQQQNQIEENISSLPTKKLKINESNNQNHDLEQCDQQNQNTDSKYTIHTKQKSKNSQQYQQNGSSVSQISKQITQNPQTSQVNYYKSQQSSPSKCLSNDYLQNQQQTQYFPNSQQQIQNFGKQFNLSLQEQQNQLQQQQKQQPQQQQLNDYSQQYQIQDQELQINQLRQQSNLQSMNQTNFYQQNTEQNFNNQYKHSQQNIQQVLYQSQNQSSQSLQNQKLKIQRIYNSSQDQEINIGSPANNTNQNLSINLQCKNDQMSLEEQIISANQNSPKMSDHSSLENSGNLSQNNILVYYNQNQSNNKGGKQERGGGRINPSNSFSELSGIQSPQAQSFPTFQNLKISSILKYNQSFQSSPNIQNQQSNSNQNEQNVQPQSSDIIKNLNRNNDSMYKDGNNYLNQNENNNELNMNNFQILQQNNEQNSNQNTQYFNPFYCFMLQQQQILQLQQSYIQELKKNAELLKEQYAASDPSSQDTYNQQKSNILNINSTSNNEFDQQNISSSSDSHLIQSPQQTFLNKLNNQSRHSNNVKENQFNLNSYGLFQEKEIGSQNNECQNPQTTPYSSSTQSQDFCKKGDVKNSRFEYYYPTENQLEELFQMYIKMATSQYCDDNNHTSSNTKNRSYSMSYNKNASKNNKESQDREKNSEICDNVFCSDNNTKNTHSQVHSYKSKNNYYHFKSNQQYFKKILIPLFENVQAFIQNSSQPFSSIPQENVNKNIEKVDKDKNNAREKKKQQIEKIKYKIREHNNHQNDKISEDQYNFDEEFENQQNKNSEALLENLKCHPEFKSQQFIPLKKAMYEDTFKSENNNEQSGNSEENEQDQEESQQEGITQQVQA